MHVFNRIHFLLPNLRQQKSNLKLHLPTQVWKKKSTAVVPTLPSPKQKEAWKAVVNSFQKLQVTDSLICLKLGVPDSSGLSQTKLSPQKLHSETDCSPAQKKHTGNKHEDIYICASQSVPQKRGLGKTSCWQGITQSRLSPSQSTHRTEKPVQVILPASQPALPLSESKLPRTFNPCQT